MVQETSSQGLVKLTASRDPHDSVYLFRQQLTWISSPSSQLLSEPPGSSVITAQTRIGVTLSHRSWGFVGRTIRYRLSTISIILSYPHKSAYVFRQRLIWISSPSRQLLSEPPGSYECVHLFRQRLTWISSPSSQLPHNSIQSDTFCSLSSRPPGRH